MTMPAYPKPQQQSDSPTMESPSNMAHKETTSMEQHNVLVDLAKPLLTLMTQIRHSNHHPNVGHLRSQLIEEMKNLERNLSEISYPIRTIVATRYCLCTAIDEAVLSHAWGTRSIWVQESLLTLFHKETWGGERFYIILEDMLNDIRQNIDFIELCYFLLSLGFEGKFHGQQQQALREEIRNRIFYRIRHTREKPEKNLSPNWQDVNPLGTQSAKKTKWWRLETITAGLLISMALFFNLRLSHHATPTLNKLAAIGTVSPITTFSQVIQRHIVPRLKD